MNKKLPALMIAAALLAACGEDGAKQEAQTELACNAPSVVQGIHSDIQKIIRQEARSFARSDSRNFVDADKIIAAATQLDITLEDAKTVREGNKFVCSAGLKIVIPSEIAKTAEANSPLIYSNSSIAEIIEHKVMGSNLRYADNSFATNILYTPDKEGGLSFEDNVIATTAQTLSAALLPYGVKSIVLIDGKAVSKEDAVRMSSGAGFAEPPEAEPEDILDNNAASQTEGIPQDLIGIDAHPEILNPRGDDDAQKSNFSFSDLENARMQNRQAESEIVGVWNGMERGVQQRMEEEQRGWLRSKQQNCRQAASGADNPAQAEYRQLQCDTRMTRERAQYLRGYSIN